MDLRQRIAQAAALPRLQLNPEVRSLLDFRYEDIAIEDYAPHPAIKAEVAV